MLLRRMLAAPVPGIAVAVGVGVQGFGLISEWRKWPAFGPHVAASRSGRSSFALPFAQRLRGADEAQPVPQGRYQEAYRVAAEYQATQDEIDRDVASFEAGDRVATLVYPLSRPESSSPGSATAGRPSSPSPPRSIVRTAPQLVPYPHNG